MLDVSSLWEILLWAVDGSAVLYFVATTQIYQGLTFGTNVPFDTWSHVHANALPRKGFQILFLLKIM